MYEIVFAPANAGSKAVQEERSNAHILHVTEVLRERSALRPVQVMPEVVARPVAGAAVVTQHSVEYISREASRDIIDDVLLRLTLMEKAKKYSTRLLMQYMLMEYRHHSSRMYNMLLDNGNKRVVAVGNAQARLT